LNEGEDAMRGDTFFRPLELQGYKFRCSARTYVFSAIFQCNLYFI